MPSTVHLSNNIVSTEWLCTHLNTPNLVVLEASMPQVNKANDITETTLEQIPKARFFDIKNTFSKPNAPFPNTFPSISQFETEAQKLGINSESAIVVYDNKGIYSSARSWWMFKAFGHTNVAVLNGGLPAWKKAGFKTEKSQPQTYEIGNFKAEYQPDTMKFFEDVVKISKEHTHTILDARSKNRFAGTVPEPRDGLRSGTIPNALNLPYNDLLENGYLKSKEDLTRIFKAYALKSDALTFSCGSGITACVLALGATVAGYKALSVYDGSWTEWGSLTNT